MDSKQGIIVVIILIIIILSNNNFAEIDQNLRLANYNTAPFSIASDSPTVSADACPSNDDYRLNSQYYRRDAWKGMSNNSSLEICRYDRQGAVHEGEDWNLQSGDKTDTGELVYAMANGIIITASIENSPGLNGCGGSSDYGGVVFIEHQRPNGSRYYSRYAHLREITRIRGYVRRGEIIGKIGCTGSDTNAVHLHWDVQRQALWNFWSDLNMYTTNSEKARYYPSSSTSKSAIYNHPDYSGSGSQMAALEQFVSDMFEHPSRFVVSNFSSNDKVVFYSETDPQTTVSGTPPIAQVDSLGSSTISYYTFNQEDYRNTIISWKPNLNQSGYYEVFVTYSTSGNQGATQYIIRDSRGRGYLPILIEQRGDWGEDYSELNGGTKGTSIRTESLGIFYFSTLTSSFEHTNKVELHGYISDLNFNNASAHIDTMSFRFIGSTLRNTFPDVNNGDWYAPFVRDLYKRNIINGESDNDAGNFNPGEPRITRGEFLKWCILGARIPLRTEGTTFNDVPESHVFFKYIQTARNCGYVQGCGSGNFCPDNSLNRVEAAKIIVEVFQLKVPQTNELKDLPYSDVTDRNEWYYPYIQRVTELGLFHGYDDGTFLPGEEINKAEAAKIVSIQIRNNENQFFRVNNALDLIHEDLLQ